MTLPTIIGLSGRKQSGKDTLGLHLMYAHGYQRVAFADKLREALLAVDPLVEVYGDGGVGWMHLRELVSDVGWDRAKLNTEVRRLMQTLGTEMGRNMIDGDLWVNLALKEMRGGRTVFTDVRYSNEVEAIHRLGGVVLRIQRPALGDNTDAHSSETGVDSLAVDGEVLNQAPLESPSAAHRIFFVSAAIQALEATEEKSYAR